MAEPPRVYVVMALHCHQPVGNFGFVFEKACAQAYEPFVALLERHPAIRVALHYSGSLLDWCEEHRPELLLRLRQLVQRGQVEMLASGYYEPVLPLIPEADRQGQVAWMRRSLARQFGEAGHGLWLTERVWEPELPDTLAKAGIRHTFIDTSQFQSAQAVVPASLQVRDEDGWDVLGCYTTDYAGQSVTVFPMSKRLRYWIPFQDVSRTIDWLRRLDRPTPVAVTYADDGEKFGLWPGTHQWVYEQGWLEQFFTALERESSWLKTATPADYCATVGPSGRVYLPSGSYEEMLQWSGGSFRNFLVKYPESNAMYQKMLTASRELQALQTSDIRHQTSGKKTRKDQDKASVITEAQGELYMAQCNDAYWHGVFGGLYLAHLRQAVYRHLIQADTCLQRAHGSWPLQPMARDVDGDGRAEVVVATPMLQVAVDPDEGGAVTEFSLRRPAVNLLNTLTRRPEPYHDKLRAKHLAHIADAGGSPASIHEGLKAKEAGLEAYLLYDDHRRTAFLDYGFASMPTLQEIQRSSWSEHRLWSQGAWTIVAPSPRRVLAAPSTRVTWRRELPEGRATKTLTVFHRAPRAVFHFRADRLAAPVVALEFNLGLLNREWAAPAWRERETEVELRDPHQGVTLLMRATPAAGLATFPIETVSDSEEGMERTPQGIAVVWLWRTARGASWSCDVEWSVRTS